MTVVDTRGRRQPAGLRDRNFSGPPAARPGTRPAAPRPRSTAATQSTSRRPGAAAIWAIALGACLLGSAVGAAEHAVGYLAPSVAYLFAAPLAAGLVRRGRALRMVVLCLPLAYVTALGVSAACSLAQSSLPVGAKTISEQVGQALVLGPGWLWAGTLLAVGVACRRGLLRRH